MNQTFSLFASYLLQIVTKMLLLLMSSMNRHNHSMADYQNFEV